MSWADGRRYWAVAAVMVVVLTRTTKSPNKWTQLERKIREEMSLQTVILCALSD